MPNSAATKHQHPDAALRQLRQQFFKTLLWPRVLRWTTIWLFVWGIAALLVRVSSTTPSARLLWGALGLALVGGLATWQAGRACPPSSALRAWLDERNQCGGLLMAAAEETIGEWDTPAVALPRLRWRNRQAWALLALASSFVALSLLVPTQWAGARGTQALDITREADQLKADLTTLQEAGALPADKAQALDQQLQQIQQEAAGNDPVKTWEALDQLDHALGQTAREAAQQTAQQQQQLNQAAALNEALQTGSQQLDQQTLTEALQTLAALSEQALQNEAQALPKELQQALKDGKLSAAQMQQMAQALQQKQGQLNQQLAKLAQTGLIKPGDLKQGATAGKRDNSGLAKHLAENAQKQPLSKTLGEWCEGDKDGNGEIKRGRGDAELDFGEMAKEDGAQFKQKTLPPAAVSELQNSQLIGLSSAAPTVQTSVTAHGALNQSTAGGGSAYTQTVLPRHKGAVKRYFNREAGVGKR